MTDKYNFASLEDVLKAISELPDNNKKVYNTGMDQIEVAGKVFLNTRSNSELMNLADETVIIGGDEVSVYDYMGSFWDWYEAEVDSRNWPIADSVMEVVKQWDADWADDGSSFRKRFLEMEKQVAGIQKKVDKLVKLLEGSKVTLSVEEALRL
jgi:hypothetical protein